MKELESRGWSRSEAARRGDISPSMFDKVINGYAEPGMKFLKGISKAFGISLHEAISWLDSSSKNSNDERRSRFETVLDELSDDDVDDLYALAISKLERKNQKKLKTLTQ